MQVLAVASEIYPLVKTGGLADVAGALPLALKSLGINTRTLIPGYPSVLSAVTGAAVCHRFEDLLGTAGPIEIEIGCGKGRFLSEYAALHPERPLLGIGQLRLQRCRHLQRRLLRFRQLTLHQTSVCFSLGKLSLQMMPTPLQCGVLFTQLADQPCLRRALLNVH